MSDAFKPSNNIGTVVAADPLVGSRSWRLGDSTYKITLNPVPFVDPDNSIKRFGLIGKFVTSADEGNLDIALQIVFRIPGNNYIGGLRFEDGQVFPVRYAMTGGDSASTPTLDPSVGTYEVGQIFFVVLSVKHSGPEPDLQILAPPWIIPPISFPLDTSLFPPSSYVVELIHQQDGESVVLDQLTIYEGDIQEPQLP